MRFQGFQNSVRLTPAYICVISSSMEIGGFNGNVGDCADVQRKRELLISEVCMSPI